MQLPARNLKMAASGKVFTTLAIILACWDGVAVYFLGGEVGSVSAGIINLTGMNPTPFYFGFICGHLFANMWVDTTRLKAAWIEWAAYPHTDRVKAELAEAIEEVVNANHGPSRYLPKSGRP